MEVHETIRSIRELNKLTQEDMAEKLSISVNGYSKIERGLSKLTLDKLHQIADIFNINVSDLFSAKEKGFFCLFSENSQNNSTYYASNELVTLENEKLKLENAHKDDLLASKEIIIEQKNNEIKALKEIIDLLKEKVSS